MKGVARQWLGYFYLQKVYHRSEGFDTEGIPESDLNQVYQWINEHFGIVRFPFEW